MNGFAPAMAWCVRVRCVVVGNVSSEGIEFPIAVPIVT